MAVNANTAPVSMEDPKKQLIAHLKLYGVPEACITFITAAEDDPVEANRGLGFECLSDMASSFTERDHPTEIKDSILAKVPTCKGNLKAYARIVTAWKMASAELEKSKKRRIEGVPEADWDLPLEDVTEIQRKVDFEAAYGELRFESESTPGANLMGRWFREFRSPQRQISLTSLHKMRSEADFKQLGMVKRTELAKGFSLVADGSPTLPDMYFDSVMKFMSAVKLMTNGWALTGYMMVTSKTQFDQTTAAYKQVRNCHLTEAIAYYDFVFRKALEFHGSETNKIMWLTDRDRQTRAKAKSLYAAGFPWGEAMTHAKDQDCIVLWTIATDPMGNKPSAVIPDLAINDPAARGQQAQLTRAQRRKAAERAKGKGKGKGAKNLCNDFNKKKGCERTECNRKHACSKCGRKGHGASTCRD
jgi:hypothetical protein